MYEDFIKANLDTLDIFVSFVIDNKTMCRYTYWRSNVFCDGNSFYKDPARTNSLPLKGKKALRVRLAKIGGKLKLHSTNNDESFTRIIYKSPPYYNLIRIITKLNIF